MLIAQNTQLKRTTTLIRILTNEKMIAPSFYPTIFKNTKNKAHIKPVSNEFSSIYYS